MSEIKLTNPTPYAFIPKPLTVKGKPKLKLLPFNVLFVSWANINGVDTRGSSLYEPYSPSYVNSKDVQFMRYYNKYSETDYIDIQYSFIGERWDGIKYVRGVNVCRAFGKTWKSFFVHLTMTGLQSGEGCKFERCEKL